VEVTAYDFFLPHDEYWNAPAGERAYKEQTVGSGKIIEDA